MYPEDEKPQKESIFRKYLKFVDSTRFFTTPFSWLYVILALVFIAVPVLVFLQGLDNHVFKGGVKLIAAFILLVLASIAATVIAFVVAWNGRKKNSVDKITIELIIDSVADFLALIIKSAAHLFGILGFFAGLFALIFDNSRILAYAFLPSYWSPVSAMLGSLLGGYALVWYSRLFKFLFAKINRIFVMVIIRIFKFIVFYVIVKIYNLIAHVVKQWFDYFIMVIRAGVDLLVNGFKVLVALVARLGRFLFAYASSPFKNKEYNDAKITYNE